MEKLVYPGYMSDECITFFGDKLIREDREGCAVVGHFVKLKGGNTTMPTRNDIFIKDENNNIALI